MAEADDAVIYRFADCELDLRRCELRRAGEPYHVEPQVFDVLSYLVRHRDRLVTKDELLDRIWGHRFVTPAALNARVKAARQAVGDDGQAQSVIRTVRRRGFRFVAPVTVDGDGRAEVPAAGPVPVPPSGPSRDVAPSESPGAVPLVARPAELARLQALLGTAEGGRRQIVFIGGDSGIGKTTLVDAFVARIVRRPLRLARGQCLEQRGAGEPYQPLLDALSRLCRRPDGEAVIEVLARCAPTWLLQMPALLSAEQIESLRERTQSATRERMLREMVEALEELSSALPLLLLLEDVHWSDTSTLDLLLWAGLRSDAARLLVVATFRPTEVSPAFATVLERLRRSPDCTTIELAAWSAAEIAEYLAVRFPGSRFPGTFVPLIHGRTAGNPLFVRSLLDDWIQDGKLTKQGNAWTISGAIEELANDLPSTLRDSLLRRVGRLDERDQAVLEAASVAGAEFAAAAVAAALEITEDLAEDRCSSIARDEGLLTEICEIRWADGTYTTLFRFSHDLYREVIYQRIPARRRARMHRRIGLRLEAAAGSTQDGAAELALHFVRGRDPARAITYVTLAARIALQRSAPAEAIVHLQTALEFVEALPPAPERWRTELELRQMLGPALLEYRGWRDAEAERVFACATELATQLGDAEGVSNALYRLAYLLEFRGDYLQAQSVLEQRLDLREVAANPRARLEAHDLLSCSLFNQGRFEDALTNAREALGLVEAGDNAHLRIEFGHDPVVSTYYWAGHALWFLGYPDQALALAQKAREIAVDSADLLSQALAEARLARIRQCRCEPDLARRHASAALEIADRQGFPFPRAIALTLLGWAEAQADGGDAALERIRAGLRAEDESGALMERPYSLGVYTDALHRTGRIEQGLTAVSEAMELVEQGARAHFWEAELFRLRGELLLKSGDASAAESSFGEALDIAARQQARSLQLRAALSLYRMQTSADGRVRATRILEPIHAGFREGLDTPDHREAARILTRKS